MENIKIIVFTIAIIVMLIYGFRKQIKAWIIKKLLEYASKEMMKKMGAIDMNKDINEEKKK